MGQALATDPILAEVVDCIRQIVQPWRIVLFGSRARGDHREWSDYDVYVEVEGTDASLGDLENRVRAALPKGSSFDIKARTRGTIERRRDDPGTIEWDVAREGVLLFADPAAPTRLGPPGRVAEPPPGRPESVGEWLEAAERDLRHCRLLREQGSEFAPDICWLSHQATEKHLKALLVARGVRPERTHDLWRLLASLRAAGVPMVGLDADCELLTGHAIAPRYPAGKNLRTTDADTAFAAAGRVIAAVRGVLKRG
jgi:HEPN domain-containing protein/predicted nucleotidyltransferase